MDETKELQLLVILGETYVKLRLADDANESLAGRVKVLERENEKLAHERDALKAEKGVLLADVQELEKEVKAMKEGGDV